MSLRAGVQALLDYYGEDAEAIADWIAAGTPPVESYLEAVRRWDDWRDEYGGRWRPMTAQEAAHAAVAAAMIQSWATNLWLPNGDDPFDLYFGKYLDAQPLGDVLQFTLHKETERCPDPC